MSQKKRIAILGIGGVGGYYGGKLAKFYAGSDEVEIIFVARGATAEALRNNGLRIITPESEEVSHPSLVASDPTEIGVVDVFVMCTKAYDLEESMTKYRECIGAGTVVLPLLNGVDHAETIKKILPESEVWNGCAFIVSRIVSPGVIRVDSAIRLLQFGSFDGSAEKLQNFESLVKTAGVDVELSSNIDKTIWEKFIFISSLASLTSYLDATVGEILSSDEHSRLLKQLISEVNELANQKQIPVDENISAMVFERVKSAPTQATSSMHADFAKNGKTELETLTGYVVREAAKLGSSVPGYAMVYEALKSRAGSKTQVVA